jgi:2-keto-4-pentenoate hydratase/2-oxohepta-3-ene-1,7-dioic acid hydratase in catechol pathway
VRLARLVFHGEERSGVVAEDGVHLLPPGISVDDLIQAGLARALEVGAQALRDEPVDLDDVGLLAPLRPRSVRDFVAFEEHVRGVRRSIDGVGGVPDAWYDAPTFYFTNASSVIGTGDDVAVPGGSQALDFELEVATVVGARGRDLTPATAKDVVFGFTILNDWSARDLQGREMQVNLGPCKGKDFASTLGPWIVTADEMEQWRDDEGFLDVWCTAEVNGAVVGQDLLSNIGWTPETMVAYASRDADVHPGDVLGSGTVGNGGCLAELWGINGSRTDPPPLQAGDVVTLTVEGIGSISNRVVPGRAPQPLPAPRRRDTASVRASHPRRPGGAA